VGLGKVKINMIKLSNILNELEIPSGKWIDMKMSDVDV
jgi:hypothetical protein